VSVSGPPEVRPLLKPLAPGLSVAKLHELRLIAQEREDHYTRMVRDAERYVPPHLYKDRLRVRRVALRNRLDAWVTRIEELERRIAAEEKS
jgi:hypothetical protein